MKVHINNDLPAMPTIIRVGDTFRHRDRPEVYLRVQDSQGYAATSTKMESYMLDRYFFGVNLTDGWIARFDAWDPTPCDIVVPAQNEGVMVFCRA